MFAPIVVEDFLDFSYARAKRVQPPLAKDHFGVAFASFFVPMSQGTERETIPIFHLLNIRDL